VLEVLRRITQFELTPRRLFLAGAKRVPDGQYTSSGVPSDLAPRIVELPWLPRSLMPAYYALGDVTLCWGVCRGVGSNVALESIACGVSSGADESGSAPERDS